MFKIVRSSDNCSLCVKVEAYEVMLVLVSGLLNRLNNHSILIFFYPLSDRYISYILAGYHRLKITLY